RARGESLMRFGRLVLIGLLVVAVSGVPVSVGASPTTFTLGAPVLVSGASPFAACTVGSAGPTSINYVNTEVEPFVAVNPGNKDQGIGVFQQDRWNDGGAKGLVAARSSDGGASWSRNSAAFSACSGGASKYERATDPWVSFDAGGRAYQISL